MAGKQRVPLGIVGPSSKAYSVAQQSAVTVNMVPVMSDVDAKAVVALRAAQGSFRWADLTSYVPASARIRGMHSASARMFAAVGSKVLELTKNLLLTSFSTAIELATLPTTAARVGFSDNNGYLVVGDGFFWTLQLGANTLAAVLNDGEEQLAGYYSCWIDGTTIYLLRDSSTYYYSELNDPTAIRGLSFFSAEFNPDNTVAAFAVNGELIILGERSTEWHYDAGEGDNPFQRIAGGHVEYGCVGRWACCKIGNSVLMVGRSPEGQGAVYRLGSAGSQPERISSPAVEAALEKVLFAFDDVTDEITMFASQDGGAPYAVLNLPAVPATANNPAQASMTWRVDEGLPANLAWNQLGYTNPATGQYERIRADFHVSYAGRHYTGDYDLPYVYEVSHDYFRENTIPLVKTRVTPHLSMQGRRFSVNRIEIEGETGVGRDGNAVGGTDPQIMAAFSWDGGRTFSNEIQRSWGKIGEYKCRALIGPCGSGYDFVLRVACSEPIRFVLTGGWADVTVGG